MRKLLVVLAVLGLAFVGADRVAHSLATDEAEQRLASEGVTEPSVQVRGFPFLTQLLSRQFAQVDVDAAALDTASGRARHVTATGREVRVGRGQQVTVGELSARAVVTYDEVLREAGLPGLRLEPAGGGKVRLHREVSALGQSLTVSATARVESRGERLRVVPMSVSLADGSNVNEQLAAVLIDQLSFSYRLRDLPEGLEVRRIDPTERGFAVEVSGQDVVLSG